MGGIRNGFSNYGNRKFITMAVHVSAFAIIAIQRVTGFKIELFGNPNSSHKNSLMYKGIQFVKPIPFRITFVGF
jgi:hypothetical protein